MTIKDALNKLANETATLTVALQDIRYIDAVDDFSTTVLRAINKGETLSPQQPTEEGEYYLPESNQVEQLFKDNDLEQAAQRTNEIAEMIDADISLHQQLLPKFPLSKDTKTTEFLKEQCLKGLAVRVPQSDERYTKRLDYELAVIQKMGFEDYF